MTVSPNTASETITNSPTDAAVSPPKVPADVSDVGTKSAIQPEAEAGAPSRAKQEPAAKSEAQ